MYSRKATGTGPSTCPTSIGSAAGEMVWVGGQVDLTPEGAVCNSGDLAAQIRSVMAHFGRVLDELDCDLEDLVILHCFYVNDGSVDERAFLSAVGECLPPRARPAVSAVPAPYLAYEGLQVEIEGYAMRLREWRADPSPMRTRRRRCPRPSVRGCAAAR